MLVSGGPRDGAVPKTPRRLTQLIQTLDVRKGGRSGAAEAGGVPWVAHYPYVRTSARPHMQDISLAHREERRPAMKPNAAGGVALVVLAIAGCSSAGTPAPVKTVTVTATPHQAATTQSAPSPAATTLATTSCTLTGTGYVYLLLRGPGLGLSGCEAMAPPMPTVGEVPGEWTNEQTGNHLLPSSDPGVETECTGTADGDRGTVIFTGGAVPDALALCNALQSDGFTITWPTS